MKASPSGDKLRGGYYTPSTIAEFLARWVARKSGDSILEPSCGDGNILVPTKAALDALKSGRRKSTLVGVEIFPTEAAKARKRVAVGKNGTTTTEIVTGSFFDWARRAIDKGVRFDAVVGNPPFVRYQDFPEDQRTVAFELLREVGLNPTRLTNSWMPFVVASARLLNETGRLAFVLPAELFQVNYAAETRLFLSRYFRRITIVTFRELVFAGIQQEVILLLAENDSRGSRGIRVHELTNASELATLSVEKVSRAPLKPLDHASEKWTKYFLSKEEIALLRRLRERDDIPLLRSFLDVDVGVVTGENDFFVLNDETKRNWSLEGSCLPIVGRSASLQGLVFSKSEFAALAKEGKPTNLFAPFASTQRTAGVRNYIKSGEKRGVNKGYKCRIRKEWFVVPTVWIPDLFALRQIDQYPKLIVNDAGATCTDTIHRVRLADGVSAKTLAVAFMNSLTFAASEVTGRSYGGGVMTFEPSEMERLPLPVHGASELDFKKIDALVRTKEISKVLDLVDAAVLQKGLGLPKSEIAMLRSIWRKLADRRRARKTRAK